MLDPFIRRWIERPLHALGTVLSPHISANQITLLGLFLGLGALPSLWYQQYDLALGFILVNRVFDGLDGAVARIQGPSDWGGYLDIVSDFLFYASVAFGFALAQPHNAVYAALLLFSFMGTASTFLAFAILAAKRGMDTETRGKKSFYYLGGVAEGTETVLFFLGFCLFPQWFVYSSLIFSGLCWVTTVSRILITRDIFAQS